MDLSLIIEKNPWRKNKEEIKNDEYVKEAFSRKHKNFHAFEHYENIVFVGPRRAGKTTFFKLLIYDLLLNKNTNPQDILYVSCEILKDHNEILEIFRLMTAKYFFLDEITFVNDWEKSVKFALDQGILKDKIVYITGSSTAFFRKETFPGRKIKFVHFFPTNFLRFSEIFGSSSLLQTLESLKHPDELAHHFPEIFNMFLKYMECGGFPKPMFQLMEDGAINHENYEELFSWFRGDMLKMGKSEEISKALIARLIETIATPVAYNSVGNYVGISHRIAREYIETMKSLMYMDFCYHIDAVKKIPIFRKEKKMYFLDPFIVKMFEKKIIGKEITDESKMAELIAFNSLKQLNQNVFIENTNGETDFFVDGERFEVKWREQPKPRKNTVILTKKDYNPGDMLVPLPVFILYSLKKQTLRVFEQ